MAASVGTPSPPPHNQRSASLMGSSPFISPSSDKRFWSTLRNRIDVLIDERSSRISTSENAQAADLNIPNKSDVSKSERAKRLKEDSLLLMRGFDSVSQTLSQLSNTLDNALQGARDLAKPPTLTEIFHSNLRNLEAEEDNPERENEQEPIGGRKRKLDQEGQQCSEDFGRESEEEIEEAKKEKGLKKAKNLAVTMATRAASLARELKSLKPNLCFLQERSALLEEENRRLRDGFARGIRPEEDDLVRLQMEALLAEKSRLANENANLVRENQCLHQLVEYHQITSQDLSASYEQFIHGMCLDFSSPPPAAIGEEEEEFFEGEDDENKEVPRTPPADSFRFSTRFDENEQ